MLEQLLRRDRQLMAFGLAVTTVLAWFYLLREAAAMNAMAAEAQMHAAMGMADLRMWGGSDWFGLFVMWAVMMVAMMLPSAAPMILLVLAVYRRRTDDQARTSAVMFVAGYVVAWAAFSAAAATLQIGLHRTALLAADMLSARPPSRHRADSRRCVSMAADQEPVPRALSVAAAVFDRTLAGGRARRSDDGHRSRAVLCRLLLAVMTLLFVVGVMNLWWVAALAAFVLLEKLAIRGVVVSRMAGIAAAAWGVYLLRR